MVIKIHDFLDAFGVINFNVKLDYRPSAAQASLSHWQTNPLNGYRYVFDDYVNNNNNDGSNITVKSNLQGTHMYLYTHIMIYIYL
jgi:hypothetical protein